MKSQFIFQRNSQSDLPIAAAGDGCFIRDADGKAYLDGSGGAAVSCLGHSDSHVKNAILAQMESVSYAHTSFFTSAPAEQLAARLASYAPGDINRVYLVSGGSEAIEAALKLARQYFTEIGQPERKHIIARRQSYHGNTLGALAAGGNQWRRQNFAPLLIETSLISPCYAWRDKRDDETEDDYGLRVANELETEILRLGPDQVMAFLAEPVVGATAGALCPVPGYLARIRQICDKYGVLLIFDEVMCGMGRTGALFACDIDGVMPDIITIAKGLGAGYQPIGAMLCRDYIHDAIEQGSGFFQHGHTYLGHPIAAAAANAVLDRLVDDGLIKTVAEKGTYLRSRLQSVLGQHPHIGDIRGRGLFIGIELVASRTDKTPFDPALNIAGKIKKNALAAGLACYPSQGTVDGKSGAHILLAPPFIISIDEMDMLVARLNSAIKASLPA
ncbi:MAG: aspartate aminotransferase family protein [Candidatus Puniceispirillaceae bacterium]